jgi:hypothetical protein
MATLSTIANALRLTGVGGTTNDVIYNWLKGLGGSGTTPDMLFSYLRSTGLTGGLSDMLSAYVFASITPVTDGMTLTASWVTRGTAYTTLDSAVSASVRVDATISNTDSGILMESGASGTGAILYVYAGVLYFQCGDGSTFGPSASRAEISYTLPVGTITPIIEWAAVTSHAALYIDGQEVGFQTYSAVNVTGGDSGTIGQVSNAVAVNRGGWTSSGQGGFSGTITKCDIFLNQLPTITAFTSSGVLTCSGILSCSETIPCGE